MTQQSVNEFDAGVARLFHCENFSVDVPSAEGPLRILEDVTFDIRAGEFITLVGPSGIGKTTLLRALGGLSPFDLPQPMYLRGEPVTSPPEGVVMVFQDYGASLLQWRTVARNVALGIERQLDKATVRARVDEALNLVGLASRGRDYPWRLSGGMQQRVQLARALAMRPQVLLMDEPFGALDAMTRAGLQDQLTVIQRETGCTIVFITHDVDEAVYLSDRVIVLGDQPGRIIATADVNLPRPRDHVTTKETPEYLSLRHDIYTKLHP